MINTSSVTIGAKLKFPVFFVFVTRSGFLLVDGQKQLPLVRSDSGGVSRQLRVFVDQPGLSHHVCCGDLDLKT